jgi:predicted DNA-binding transcriptional regulator AlpA
MSQTIYLNQSESAMFLRISERTLERWRIEGQGPRFRRFGRRIVYAKTDLETWADDRCYQSTSATEPLQV